MWVPLIFVILLFAIVFFQSTQGLFGAMIMMVLTLCCAALAYGSYDWVAAEYLAKYWKPDMAHAVSLAVLFGVPLLITRLIFDKLVRRSCLLPSMIDKVGGGVCGLVTGLVMVGVAGTAFQMAPLGETALGFARFDLAVREAHSGSPGSPPDIHAPDRGLWLSPDRFAARVAAMMSDGVFSGRESFYRDYPDLLQAIGWVNTINTAVSRFAPPGSLSVVSSAPVEVVYRLIPGDDERDIADQYEPISPRGGLEFQMVRVKLSTAAHDKNKTHLFSLRQFRLVGDEGGDARQYFPIATQQRDVSPSVNRHVSIKRYGSNDWPVVDELITPRKDPSNEVELVFELPSSFEPRFIEYKRCARAKVSFSNEIPAPAAAPKKPRSSEAKAGSSAKAPKTKPTKPKKATQPSKPRRGSRRSHRRGEDTSAKRSGGNIRGFSTIPGESKFGDSLPFEVTAYRDLNNTEVINGALVGGHFRADATDQEGGHDPPVSTFRVPEDKRLLQLNVGHLTARSLFGRALSHAVSVVQNYRVADSNGKEYKIIGKYALADVGGEKVFEVQYFPDQAGTVGGLGKFNRIKENDLKRGDDIVFLFLVDPGVQIVSFSTGGAASRSDDLTSENLVAPK